MDANGRGRRDWLAIGRSGVVALGLVVGVVAGGRPAVAQDGGGPTLAPTTQAPEPTPSVLERGPDGSVVWIDGDPGRAALSALDLPRSVAERVGEILADREAALSDIAVMHADKIVGARRAKAQGDAFAHRELARSLSASLGDYARRSTIVNDPEIRDALGRGLRSELAAVVREYDLARAGERLEELEARKAAGEDVPGIELRTSTILQRMRAIDVLTDAARLLEGRLGGMEKLAALRPELAADAQGFWQALMGMTDAQLASFVREATGLDVRFPSPEGYLEPTPLADAEPADAQRLAQASNGNDAKNATNNGNATSGGNSGNGGDGGGNADADADDGFGDLESMRVRPEPGKPTLLRRDADGKAVRLGVQSYRAALELMRDGGMLSEAEREALAPVLADRQRVFDRQVLRLYEPLLDVVRLGPVDAGPTHEAVLNREWVGAGLVFGAWLNSELPAPSTFHNDTRVREALERETVYELARLANEYDGAHIFDARIEIIKRLRAGELDESMRPAAMPGNIKRPWRLQDLVRRAKRSYARQLGVGEPELLEALRSLELDPATAAQAQPWLDGERPLDAKGFWELAVLLPPEAHRALIERRTGYTPPEPGFFEGKRPRLGAADGG